MSLLDDLQFLQQKSYQPLYSGKIRTCYNNQITKKINERPKTSVSVTVTNTSPDFPASPFRSHSSSYNLSQRQSTNRSSFVRNPSSTFDSKIELPNLADDNSIDISLFNVESEHNFQLDRKEYGKFNYFSYFERYMNRIAKWKIPSYLLPKPPLELNDKAEPTIYELLDESEQFDVWNQFYVEKALPFRIRSNSTGPVKKIMKKNILFDRCHSIECFKEEYLAGKLLKNKIFDISKDKEKNYDKNSMKSLLTEQDIDKCNGSKMEIRPPEIYTLGSFHLSKKKKSNLKNQSLSHLIVYQEPIKKKYMHVESKLEKYISENRQKKSSYSFTSTSRSKSAIQHHYISTNKLNTYKKPKSAHLILSKQLETKIKEDIIRNKGPIYYGELRRENLQIHNSITKIQLKDKFLYVFEWLEKMKDSECEHFFKNPFKTSVSVNTDHELRAKTSSDYNSLQSILWDKRQKIDPFDNPKYHTVRERIPTRLNSALVQNGFYETMDKQTLANKKNYRESIQLNKRIHLNKIVSLTTQNYLNTEEDILKKRSYVKKKLAQEKNLNDVLLTRMKLDLFIL